MVRQPSVRGNAGAFNNGMPQTASLGGGTWGGNITSENISVKHYMNTTWVSRPIPEDKPDERELRGEFLRLRDIRSRIGPPPIRRHSVHAGMIDSILAPRTRVGVSPPDEAIVMLC